MEEQTRIAYSNVGQTNNETDCFSSAYKIQDHWCQSSNSEVFLKQVIYFKQNVLKKVLYLIWGFICYIPTQNN